MLAAPACKDSDPNAFETYTAKIRSDEGRGVALKDLDKLVKTVSTAEPAVRDPRFQEFVDKVIPVFVEVWDASQPVERTQMLEMLRIVSRPEGAEIWNKALELDGSDEARKQALLALQGISNAKAVGSVDTLIKSFGDLIENPSKDKGKREGEIRLEMAKTLGDLKDPKAVPVLISALEKTKDQQPVAVHRQAAKALGDIGDAAATDALITVMFRVPDAPSTTDIGNRAKLALAGIGKDAVPKVISMLKGQHEEVNKLANENGVDLLVVQQSAADALGNMGAKEAVAELIAFMPNSGCVAPGAEPPDPKAKGKKKDEPEVDPADASLRAFVARSLGFIGDESAVDALCGCVHATHNPGDMTEILDALGRIGGEKATTCLVEAIKTGEFNPDTVANSDFVHEPKWIAGRWAVLAAPPSKIAEVKAAFEEANKVSEQVSKELARFSKAIEITETCGEKKDCYIKVLADANGDIVAREKAAYELVRLAKGDKAVALEMAKAFKVRNP
ncbi:MAG: HEAT repeat domain-containing protein, partial [Myxococcales bacterium]|nr:HEAT repeat domain-containing protein [Myxococcales bacterium]